MAKSQRHRNWVAKLAPVQRRPPPSIQPEWAVQDVDLRVWKGQPERRGQVGARIGKNVRVSFPVRFGIGLGIGGVDSGGVVLRLARVEGGCGVQNDDHDCGNVVRYHHSRA